MNNLPLIAKDLSLDNRIHLGKHIGTGTERVCFTNIQNPNSCYKISHQSHSKQTRREIEYFKYLKKRQIEPSFMPKFLNWYKSGEYIIIEQELLRSDDQHTFLSLRKFLSASPNHEQLNKLDSLLCELKDEMVSLNVIVCDIRTINIAVELSHDKTLKRIYIFDGYGATEFLRLPNYISMLGRRKIERQWKKFMKYYAQERQECGK